MALLDTARVHDQYTPRFKGQWGFEDNNLGAVGSRHLVYRFSLDRHYEIKAIAWMMNHQGFNYPSITEPSTPDGDLIPAPSSSTGRVGSPGATI